MAVNEFDTVNYREEARDRVTYQFTDKPIFDKYLQLLILGQVEIQEALKQVMQLRSIDTAEGEQLNVIGRIVGQPRELIDAEMLEYFGFDGYPESQSYGDLENTSTGGFYYSLGTPLTGSVLLNDEQYRLFIKAKILKNTTFATPEDFLGFVKFVFGTEINNVLAEGDAEFTILIGKELNSFERALLTYKTKYQNFDAPFVPKPVGVRINYGYFPSQDYFGFQGAPGAKGFGEVTGTFGWGLGYGLGYGASDFSQAGGGQFATLF